MGIVWENIIDQRKGSYNDLLRIFNILRALSTEMDMPSPFDVYGRACKFRVYWQEDAGGTSEIVGMGRIASVDDPANVNVASS